MLFFCMADAVCETERQLSVLVINGWAPRKRSRPSEYSMQTFFRKDCIFRLKNSMFFWSLPTEPRWWHDIGKVIYFYEQVRCAWPSFQEKSVTEGETPYVALGNLDIFEYSQHFFSACNRQHPLSIDRPYPWNYNKRELSWNIQTS